MIRLRLVMSRALISAALALIPDRSGDAPAPRPTEKATKKPECRFDIGPLPARKVARGGTFPVAEWIAREVATRGIASSGAMFVGDGRILIQAGAIVARSRAHTGQTYAVPTPRCVGRALRAISYPNMVRVGNRDFHDVRVDIIAEKAVALGLTDGPDASGFFRKVNEKGTR